jgi:hypothetical protein
MLNYNKILISCLLALFLVASPLPILAKNVIEAELNSNRTPPDPAAMAIDLIILRPLGIVATLGGSILFVLSSPFSLLGGNADDAWESLVVSPAVYTFKRPLGEFDD